MRVMDKGQNNLRILSDFCDGLKNIAFTILYRNDEKCNFFSKEILDITGYTPQEIESLPDKLYSLINEEDLKSLKKSLTELESDPSKNIAELLYRINSKSGSIVWLKESLKVYRDTDGEIKEHHSALIDVTSIKKKELELEKLGNSLKDLNASKDKFISIVSHDLRAPFTTLLGFSEILLNEKDITEDERLEYLKYIYDASKTQLNLINCLLDWSRLQTGRIKIEPIRLNVRTAVANAITPLTGDAVRKNIDIRINIPPDLYMNADERLISQAVINLVSNAIKFTPEGKEVHVSSQRFKEGMIEIVIRDEGLGISEENQSKLFKIDQKFSLVGTNGEKGSGLGLALMKEIVEKHNGHVWFYSQVGEGSEFHFTVQEAKNVVLIVEDDLAERALCKKVIESKLPNFNVQTADNGYEALSMLKTLIPTIIITDHLMPLMNGIQLIEALFKKEASRSIPVIVISAKLNNEITKVYSRLGIDKIIPKPVDMDRLIETMRECLF